jgi:hypothetical protein
VSVHIDVLGIRKRLGRKEWSLPTEYGPEGWAFRHMDGTRSIIVTYGVHGDPKTPWLHASIAKRDEMPTYQDLVALHYGVWGDKGWAYQVFAPQSDHVNIHPYALHLWGRPDGRAELPNFGEFGTI